VAVSGAWHRAAYMARLKRTRLAVLVATGLAALSAAVGAPAQAAAPSAAAKTCSSSSTHAVIGGEEKCLRAGEFCTRAFDSQYRRYGYRCTKYYSTVHRYRLTHA
jgi:hypothetical protein